MTEDDYRDLYAVASPHASAIEAATAAFHRAPAPNVLLNRLRRDDARRGLFRIDLTGRPSGKSAFIPTPTPDGTPLRPQRVGRRVAEFETASIRLNEALRDAALSYEVAIETGLPDEAARLAQTGRYLLNTAELMERLPTKAWRGHVPQVKAALAGEDVGSPRLQRFLDAVEPLPKPFPQDFAEIVTAQHDLEKQQPGVDFVKPRKSRDDLNALGVLARRTREAARAARDVADSVEPVIAELLRSGVLAKAGISLSTGQASSRIAARNGDPQGTERTSMKLPLIGSVDLSREAAALEQRVLRTVGQRTIDAMGEQAVHRFSDLRGSASTPLVVGEALWRALQSVDGDASALRGGARAVDAGLVAYRYIASAGAPLDLQRATSASLFPKAAAERFMADVTIETPVLPARQAARSSEARNAAIGH